VSCYQHLRPGDFSLRTWLESGKGNLYLTWREDMLSSLKPLVSGWVDILIAAILTLPEGNPRPLWLVLDELASLERLSSLEAGLTKGRKHGLRVVAGLQSVAQLDDLYGGHAATTLRSCLRNLLVLGCANTDPETAKVFSDGLGQSEVERTQLTHNSARGNEGGTTSRSVQRSVEPLVLPSQLTSLAPLDGYLKFAGDFPVAKIRLQPGNHPVRNKPFLEV
jgi:type IV secretory pathway TraG/TraD family ATPase VirD4